MPKYKLLTGSHSYNGVTYYKGDEIEVSKEHAERFGGKERFGPVSGSTATAEEDLTITDLLAKSVPKIEEELAEVNDIATLDAVKAEENKGEKRVGVFNAVEARRKALKGS